MVWYKTKTCRLLSMLSLTFTFFVVELVFGYVTNSLALIGDSYHMLSDVVALVVGITSVRISKMDSHKNTYGWARAEVLGALVNSVFLIALCFTIFVEAIQRLTHMHTIEHADWMLCVGVAGFVINAVGLVLFHRHSHGIDHGHSHGGHSGRKSRSSPKSQPNNNKVVETSAAKYVTADDCAAEKASLNVVTVDNQPNLDSSGSTEHDADESEASTEADVDEGSPNKDSSTTKKRKKIKSSSQLNMRGVFLHVLGDALGSVVVIVSALFIKFIDDSADWKYKVDPAMSMLMVCIILATTIPLLKESSLILMQTVPTHIQVAELKKKLIKNVEGVLAVHEFHVWQLAGNRIIASAHIRCLNLRDYMRIAEEVKSFFHNEGIHSTTIQPEFVEFEEMSPDRDCVLECGPDKTCYVDTCCARTSRNEPGAAAGADACRPETAGPGLRQRATTRCLTPEQAGTSSSALDPTTFAENLATTPSWSAPAIETTSDTRA